MKLRVKLFAVAKERVGKSAIEVDLPDGATVCQLRSAILEQHALLSDVMRHARLAVNNDYASDGAVLNLTAEIAIIPPVSGG